MRFLEGDALLWQRVSNLVCGPLGWNACSATQFCFCQLSGCGSERQPVRITFQPGSSWSHIGRYGETMIQTDASMNLAVTMQDSEHGFRYLVLHEFGHALGLLHEQEHPQGLPWDYAAFERWHLERGYDVERARVFWFQRVDPSCVVAGPYNPFALMHYYAPPEWFRDGMARGGSHLITQPECAQVERWFGPPRERWTETFLPWVARGT